MSRKLMNLIIAGVFLVLAMSVGCNDHLTGVQDASHRTNGKAILEAPTHDGTVVPFSQEDPQTGETYEGTIYTYGSIHGKQIIDTRRKQRGISSQLVFMTDKGYTLALGRSKVIETDAEMDDQMKPVEMLYLVMLHNDDSTRYAIVSYFHWQDVGDFAQSYEYATFTCPDEEGFECIPGSEPESWLKTYQPRYNLTVEAPLLAPFTGDPSANLDPQVSWKGWAKCTIAGTAGGCTTAALGCAIATIAWGPCAGLGCAASAIGASVGCAVAQILDDLFGD